MVKRNNLIVVGIGASAGGLEAVSELLDALPAKTGLAYVLIQHLDPLQKSALTEILSNKANLPVQEIKTRQNIQPDHFYVISPATSLVIKNNQLLPVRTTRRIKPIDFFFQSLAKEKKQLSVGMVLSGTGNDGTLGLKEIKKAGGMTLVQEPRTAKYPDMPKSCIEQDCADFVLHTREIAAWLGRVGSEGLASLTKRSEQAVLTILFHLLHSVKGVDFSYYKSATVLRRINRRMQMFDLKNMSDYLEKVKKNPSELEALFKDLLINVTEFFRQPKSYKATTKKVFPRIMKGHHAGDPLRLWVPGCSTGEEAYSLAISLLDFLGHKVKRVPIQIFASDLSEEAIRKARAGKYPEIVKDSLSSRQLRQYFTKTKTGYQVADNIRRLCVFAKQDLTQDPPFSSVDLISCRNVLIYLTPEAQNKILRTFHYALKPGGFLVLGSSEGLGGLEKLFSVVDSQQKIFQKKESAERPTLGFGYRRLMNKVQTIKIPHADTVKQGTNTKLLVTKRALQSVIEERDSSIEELKSANEEIQSSNEELQSMNEELETAKEELQSSNEELITLNDEMKNRNQQLNLLNDDLNNLLNSISIPVVMVDDELRLRRFNPVLTRLFNLIESDIGRPITDIKAKLDLPDLGEKIKEVLHTLHLSETEVQDDKGRWFEMQIRPYRTADNKIEGVVIAFVDITDRKLAQELALGKSLRLADLGTLAASVAHELRNPLGVIATAIYNIKQKNKDAALDKHLDNIDKKVFESSQIIGNLLSFAQIGRPHFAALDIINLMHEIVENYQQKFSQGQIKLEYLNDCCPGQLLMADQTQFSQMLNNILGNSLESCAAGTGRVEFNVHCDQLGNYLLVTIKDNGVGIKKEYLPKLFTPFFTIKSKGTGLGLSVCKQIVELHRGSISLDSEENKGTTVIIKLPLCQEVPGDG